MIASVFAYWYKGRHRLARFMRGFATSPRELVLDIGSGDSPFAPADVICEKFPWDDTERTAGFQQDRPLVVGDVEDLPFRDKSFDFIHCSHVLEHTLHPARAIRELMRVGKRGYIEMPRSYFEKTAMSTAGHLWFVDLKDEQLVFRPKHQGIIDSEINNIYENRLFEKDPLFTAFYYGRLYELFHIGMFWEGEIKFVIKDRTPAEEAGLSEVFEKASTVFSEDKRKKTRGFSLAHALKKVIHRYATRKNFTLNDVLGCPLCKSLLRQEDQSYACVSCLLHFPVQHGVPILLKESAQRVGETVQIH